MPGLRPLDFGELPCSGAGAGRKGEGEGHPGYRRGRGSREVGRCMVGAPWVGPELGREGGLLGFNDSGAFMAFREEGLK